MSHSIKSVYIAGTIGTLTATQEILDRFSGLQDKLEKLGLIVYSPVRGKKVGDKLYYSNEIVHRDELDIDRVDLLIAVFPEDKISIGTPMEIYRAREICKIPVLVVTPVEKIRDHYWIRNKATRIFNVIDECIEYVKEWYL